MFLSEGDVGDILTLSYLGRKSPGRLMGGPGVLGPHYNLTITVAHINFFDINFPSTLRGQFSVHSSVVTLATIRLVQEVMGFMVTIFLPSRWSS